MVIDAIVVIYFFGLPPKCSFLAILVIFETKLKATIKNLISTRCTALEDFFPKSRGPSDPPPRGEGGGGSPQSFSSNA